MSIETKSPVNAPGGPWASYAPHAGVCDEMLDAQGRVRPHWQQFTSLMSQPGVTALDIAREHARRIIAENGITYNVYGDPAGIDRPWQLDPAPMLVDATEWAQIEKGLVQRAVLMDAILADIYGPQRLLADGLIPAQLIFAHPGFHRSCHGIKPVGGRWLTLYAANLARDGDGRVCVVGDRTQAPSGAGYALENRIVMGRALPDVFRACQVHRLSLFFRDMRDTLKAIAPQNKENPRIVLLTPGPLNETYFEHAYLARYLGYMLVEAGDLTVRDCRVYLKMLGGLQQVDVILRRQDDGFCDPLELRQDSTLGVPGLVQAASAGHIAIANALGSGLVETPAIMGYLPRLAKHILNQDLLLPTIESFWCADPAAMQHVLANLPRMVIKSAFPGSGIEPIIAESLSAAQVRDLTDRIRANPASFVGHSQITLSTAPVLVGDRLEPRRIVLRAHIVASGDSYSVMPGALTRCSNGPDSMVVSMRRGGGSKDTWILSGGPVSNFSLLQPPDQPVMLTRAGSDLPSRVADNLFWLGRYVERAEGFVHLARGVLTRLMDQNSDAAAEVPLLLHILQPHGDPPAPDAARQQFLTALLERTEPQGLQNTLALISNIASVVRDRLSADTWRVINRIERELAPVSHDATVSLDLLLSGLDRLIASFAAFGGLVMESMTRSFAWRFLDMGRRIERALHTIALLRGTLVEPLPRTGPLLEAVLEIADNSLTYRRRYMTSLQIAPVIDLLLADETNPRSIAFQLARLSEHVDSLPRSADNARLGLEQQIALRTLSLVRLLDVEQQCAADISGRRPELDATLKELDIQLLRLSDALSQGYLTHSVVTRQLRSDF